MVIAVTADDKILEIKKQQALGVGGKLDPPKARQGQWDDIMGIWQWNLMEDP